ncbi:hypothetical protein CUMW_263660 [Citrus unshiu]|uniref:Uncharacterized protein n=1 Tax=Citrus unshiu TaxID=55188 RepID=A0A2H5QUS5_CITUN|nr:hypothetical protein CUMW_263660 [Citrus unshiu]
MGVDEVRIHRPKTFIMKRRVGHYFCKHACLTSKGKCRNREFGKKVEEDLENNAGLRRQSRQ